MALAFRNQGRPLERLVHSLRPPKGAALIFIARGVVRLLSFDASRRLQNEFRWLAP
jgi:hypothetical protein